MCVRNLHIEVRDTISYTKSSLELEIQVHYITLIQSIPQHVIGSSAGWDNINLETQEMNMDLVDKFACYWKECESLIHIIALYKEHMDKSHRSYIN